MVKTESGWGNELVSYHLHHLPYQTRRQRKKNYKERERVNRNRAGDDMFGGDSRVEALEK